MSELSTKYTPSEIEEKWYSHWEKSGYFHNEPDEREPFSIVIPPPNVTGVLHMGHMLNNTIQDALTRKARLEGKNAVWIPGTDHASIATEAKVVRMLREKGIKKSDLTREEFMAYAWEWKEKYGGIILQQLRKLGSSCDWERTAFTMDEGYSKDVIHTFVDLYRKGKLYRDYRMVNWDCEAKTVLSNEEVIHGEEQAQLFHVKYFVQATEGSQQATAGGAADSPLPTDDYVVIATQRPETIMADAAVAVHPNDPRYAHLKGKKVIVPLVNRAIPIIFDEYVDIEFGTGALKVTPAHDPNDYELGKKHGLEVIDLLNDDGTLNEKCGVPSLVGVDRFEARRHTKNLLTQAGNLVKLEDYKTNIGRSERTNTVVEPKMSLQWYVNMKAIAEPALNAVETDDIDFYPKSFKNTYRYWMDNIRDWCISRQLWWGHRIPAYYYKGETFVAQTAEEALELAQKHFPNTSLSISDLKQDEDVLDTWASSWLWPISTLNGFKNSKEFDYYYPTSVLVTGWDIIFLWVARMAMAGFEWKHERPFKAVYFTGMVRDKQRRKMSKSLGNSPDALQLIEDFGADGVRFGMLASSPAGGDLLFDEKLCEQGRNFCNKLWNALRLVKGWEVASPLGEYVNADLFANTLAIDWFDAKMSAMIVEIEDNFKQFRLSEALMGLYNFIWDDYCSWYLEMIKPEYGKPIDRETLEKTEVIFRKLMAMLHPFMPFITEEIWQQLDGKNRGGADLCVAKYPKAAEFDADLVKKVEAAKDIISKIREIRNNKGLKQRDPLVVKFQASETVKELMDTEGFRNLIKKLGVLESLQTTDVDVPNAVSFVSGTDKFYVVLNQEINVEEEREKFTKELVYQQGFLKSIDVKLSNERFVANAKPEIVANEQQKKADALARIKILEESLAGLPQLAVEDSEGEQVSLDLIHNIVGNKIETDRIEWTETKQDTEKFCEAICAFANDLPNYGKSGYLLLGIKDNGQLSGLKIDDELQKKIGAIKSDGNILPQPSITIEPKSLDNGDVLVVKVSPSLLPPVRYKGRVWIRVGPRKGVATEEEERRLIEKRVSKARSFDAEPCLDSTLDDLSLDIIKLSYLPLAIDKDILDANHREIKQQLASLRLYDTRNECPTNAGILLFGNNPMYYFPGAYIHYIKTDSAERDLSKVEIEKEFKGSLFDILKEIDNFTKNNIAHSKPVRIQDSMQDKTVSNYPYAALREFIMNAIMHRDYQSNTPIYIYEFKDRIEIQNAGGLFGNVRPENFPNMNDYRNPTIAEAMKLMRYVNRFNFGISDAQKHLKNNGNALAEFEYNVPSRFLVTVKINPEW